MEQIRRSASRTICHLSIARGSCKSVPTRNTGNLLYKRSGSTGPLVTFCLVRLSSPSVYAFQNDSTRPYLRKYFDIPGTVLPPRQAPLCRLPFPVSRLPKHLHLESNSHGPNLNRQLTPRSTLL